MKKIMISVAPVAATDILINPRVIARDVYECYKHGAAMGLPANLGEAHAAEAVIQFVKQLSGSVGIPATLAQLNKVDPANFGTLADLALRDTCMTTNQLTPTRQEVIAVYTAAFRG